MGMASTFFLLYKKENSYAGMNAHDDYKRNMIMHAFGSVCVEMRIMVIVTGFSNFLAMRGNDK